MNKVTADKLTIQPSKRAKFLNSHFGGLQQQIVPGNGGPEGIPKCNCGVQFSNQ